MRRILLLSDIIQLGQRLHVTRNYISVNQDDLLRVKINSERNSYPRFFGEKKFFS